MSRCYIFSNCRKTTNEMFIYKVEKLNIHVDDTLVFLNECYMFYNNLYFFKRFNNINVVLRSCSVFGIEHYFGINSAMKNQRFINTLYCIAPCKDSSIWVVKGNKDSAKPSSNTYKFDWIDEYRKATNCDPTTGYCSFYLAQDLMGFKPEKITLVNFYGNDDSSTPKDPSHDWNFENNWLKERTRVFC